jgi:signal transduction histidine kinase
VDGLNYARADGLDQLEFPGGFGPLVARAPDGAIWMASLSGVVRLDPAVTSAPMHDEAEAASPVAVMAARVDGTAADATGLAMAPEAHRLEVEFGVVGLRSPEKARTRYRLTGYDETWIEATGQGQATYTELPPGDYAFEVLGRDGLGRWSEAPVTLSVTVIPAWWQRPIWQAIMVLMGVGLSWWIGQAYANRRLRLRLERVQHEQALTRERERIARDIHDILGANLARLRHLGGKVVNTDVATQEDLAKVGALCAESMDNLRELVWACDPKCDTLVSTVDFLEQQIGEVAREVELAPVFEITPDLPDHELAANQRHALLLMFREAMTNTITHAGAKTLTFRVTVEGLAVHLSLADDGLGFEAGLIPMGGHGLGNMPERARAAGLEYELQSEPGQGTKISVVLPLA